MAGRTFNKKEVGSRNDAILNSELFHCAFCIVRVSATSGKIKKIRLESQYPGCVSDALFAERHVVPICVSDALFDVIKTVSPDIGIESMSTKTDSFFDRRNRNDIIHRS